MRINIYRYSYKYIYIYIIHTAYCLSPTAHQAPAAVNVGPEPTQLEPQAVS